MAFRKKIYLLEELTLDIAIIQECEHIDKINHPKIHQKLWVGENKNKGVGIFSFNPKMNIELVDFNLENNHWFIPFKINGSFQIIAVWAMNHRDNEIIDKIQPTYRTIENNKDLFNSSELILGDFNNNVIWDKKGSKKYQKGTFNDINKLLQKLDFKSAYHLIKNEPFGNESIPSHIWRKNFDTVYHIDYCFIKKNHFKTYDFEILNNKSWINHSDHFPLKIDLEIESA
jgi:hypothetical protein